MKAEEITKLYFRGEKKPVNIDRREFVKNLGGGVIILFTVGDMAILNSCKEGEEKPDQTDFNAYLRVREDGRVDCYSGKVEMGQGVTTSISQVLAEELEVPIRFVNMVMGDTELCPHDDGTWGSMTTRFHDPIIRAAAAEARMVLIELASKKLKVPADQLKAVDGVVVAVNDESKKINYSEITRGEKIVKKLKTKPELKKAGEFNLIGKPVTRIEAEDKVTGKANYAGDIRLPGMKYAVIKRPPALDSRLISVDTAEAETMEGVEIVREGDFICVLHEYPETATLAAAKIKAEWEKPQSQANDQTIFDYILATATESNIVEQAGDIEKAKQESDVVVEEKYYDNYKAHASIETHTATAFYENGKLTMWASSQTPFGTRQAISEEFKLPLEKVHLKQIHLGGGFGGKIYNQQAIEAARIAILSGKPIQLAWSRREEFMYDMFRPAATMKIAGGVNKDGKLNLWNFEIYCAGSRGTQLFYNIPNHLTRTWDAEGLHPLGTGAWRAPGNNTTTFARESHIDILANKAGIDPVEFRLNNLNDDKMGQTLRLAAEKFGWKPVKTPSGNGWGVALGFDAGTYVATIAEVKVDKKTGKVMPVRIVVAQHMGQVVNPHGATIQTEGGTIMGLGYALTEDVEFDWKEVKTRNFDTYPITKFSITPVVECYFIDAMDLKPEGGGEPAIITVGGAIANAVYDACGARVFQQPLTPERVLAALKG